MKFEVVWLLTLEDIYVALSRHVEYHSTEHTELHCTTLRSSTRHYEIQGEA